MSFADHQDYRGDDLRQQKDAAYRERDVLVCALSKLWPAHLTRHPDSDTTWEDDWRWIVCIHAPVGQLTWHIHDSERAAFGHLIITDGDWDGHTTEEKYARLAALRAMPDGKIVTDRQKLFVLLSEIRRCITDDHMEAAQRKISAMEGLLKG